MLKSKLLGVSPPFTPRSRTKWGMFHWGAIGEDYLHREPEELASFIKGIHTGPSHGWLATGYHAVVTAKGWCYTDRPLDAVGAHCRHDYNKPIPADNYNSFGILVGMKTPGDWRGLKDETVEQMIQCCLAIWQHYGGPVKMVGHRESSATECPGNLIQSVIDEVEKLARKRYAKMSKLNKVEGDIYKASCFVDIDGDGVIDYGEELDAFVVDPDTDIPHLTVAPRPLLAMISQLTGVELAIHWDNKSKTGKICRLA